MSKKQHGKRKKIVSPQYCVPLSLQYLKQMYYRLSCAIYRMDWRMIEGMIQWLRRAENAQKLQKTEVSFFMHLPERLQEAHNADDWNSIAEIANRVKNYIVGGADGEAILRNNVGLIRSMGTWYSMRGVGIGRDASLRDYRIRRDMLSLIEKINCIPTSKEKKENRDKKAAEIVKMPTHITPIKMK